MLQLFEECYHGTTYQNAKSVCRSINLEANVTTPDFGKGFYLTSNFHQAVRWARGKANDTFRKDFPAIVTVRLDLDRLKRLHGLVLHEPNRQWGKLIANCRLHPQCKHDYHYVCGYMADGGRKLFHALENYDEDKLDEFVRNITPMDLTQNQLSLHTKEAIGCIISLSYKMVSF